MGGERKGAFVLISGRWRRILSHKFVLLFSATISARSDKSVVEMLRAGLLAAFVSLTKVESVPDSARRILRQTLPPSMVYYSVLSRPRLHALAIPSRLRNSADTLS
ncbi:hypothetical protein C8R44DRAFT_774569 [Mycena epipterygia]|nr:hypothetical protein C8R44DRAFT_774569 [Mycena epipterygia]